MSRWKLLFTIFAVTFSTMLVEVLLTRVFSVLYFGQFAFLIISLALFGYGLSGVFLALRRDGPRATRRRRRLLARFLLLFAVSLPLAYKATLLLSIDFLHLFNPVDEPPVPGPQLPDPPRPVLQRRRRPGPHLRRPIPTGSAACTSSTWPGPAWARWRSSPSFPGSARTGSSSSCSCLLALAWFFLSPARRDRPRRRPRRASSPPSA